MNVSLRFSRQAQRDVIDIWRRIAAFDAAAAEAIVDRIEDACQNLRAFPNMGRLRPELATGGRVLIVDHWLVLYRTKPGEVLVVRILDGRRDLTKIAPIVPV